MNKPIPMSILLLALIFEIIIGVTAVYEFVCIRELGRDMAELSADIQQLEDDSRSLNRDVQDVRYNIKEINKTLDHILAKLWLTRPPMPENNRPIPAAKEK